VAICDTRDKKLRAEVIWLYHDTLVGEYRRQWKMMELVTRNFWWPKIIKKVKLPKKQESYRGTSREINIKCSTRKILGLYYSRFHHKVTISTEIQ